jgi:uncharacterized protein (DUF2126 family)
MLPDFVRRDLREVLARLRQSGYNFEDEWFAAHLEFRFPKIGSIAADGVELELRQALEPWNVLAEETFSGRTVRSVDSSMERMQVKVSGFTMESRYVVACNGRRCRFNSTGEPGTALAGVRFRARRLVGDAAPYGSRSCAACLPPYRPLEGATRLANVLTMLDHPTARLTQLVQPTRGS